MPRRQPVRRADDEVAAADDLDLSAIAEILTTVPDPQANLIAVLQRVQGQYGYLPEPVIREIARLADVPASRIYGVVTFYAQFSTVPSGRHKVCICQGTACHVRGGHGVLRTAENELGLTPGETAEDLSFSLETAACLGACSLAPVMTVDGQYYGKLTAAKVVHVLEQQAEADDDE